MSEVRSPGDNYLKRASELRAEAATKSDPNTKKMLLDVAHRYDQLATALEILARASKD